MGENISYTEGSFDFEKYMKAIGRWPKPLVSREEIEDLPGRPSWEQICRGFSDDDEAPKMENGCRVVVNNEKGPNSYFGAVKSPRILG